MHTRIHTHIHRSHTHTQMHTHTLCVHTYTDAHRDAHTHTDARKYAHTLTHTPPHRDFGLIYLKFFVSGFENPSESVHPPPPPSCRQRCVFDPCPAPACPPCPLLALSWAPRPRQTAPSSRTRHCQPESRGPQHLQAAAFHLQEYPAAAESTHTMGADGLFAGLLVHCRIMEKKIVSEPDQPSTLCVTVNKLPSMKLKVLYFE